MTVDKKVIVQCESTCMKIVAAQAPVVPVVPALSVVSGPQSRWRGPPGVKTWRPREGNNYLTCFLGQDPSTSDSLSMDPEGKMGVTQSNKGTKIGLTLKKHWLVVWQERGAVRSLHFSNTII